MRSLVLIFMLTLGCTAAKTPLKVAVDPNWNEIDPRGRERYLDGFTQDLLLEIAAYEGRPIELVPTNADSLYDGLRRGQYDLVFSALPRTPVQKARYDLSDNVLAVGPVLITTKGSQVKGLHTLQGTVGMLEGTSDGILLTSYPNAHMRTYPSIPTLLDAVAGEEIQAAILDRLAAIGFIGDLYESRLQVAGEPLSDAGIHFTATKGSSSLEAINRALERLEKRGKIDTLHQKWQL